MIKVINISNKTVTINGVEIKPKSGQIFKSVTNLERGRIGALVGSNQIRAYEGDYSNELKKEDTILNRKQTEPIKDINIVKSKPRKSK